MEVEATEKATIKAPVVEVDAAARATIKAPAIELKGPTTIFGPLTTAPGENGEGQGAEMAGDLVIQQGDVYVPGGDIAASGSVTASGPITDGGGNTNHHSH